MMDGHMSSGDWFWMTFVWFFVFWTTLGALAVWAVKQWQTTKRANVDHHADT
jgi:hypothetical protein